MATYSGDATGTTPGIRGGSTITTADAVLGIISANGIAAVRAVSTSSGVCYGVRADVIGTGAFAIYGVSDGNGGMGVYGKQTKASSWGSYGENVGGTNGWGVTGYATGTNAFGVVGAAPGSGGVGVCGDAGSTGKYGVYAIANSGNTGTCALYASATGGGGTAVSANGWHYGVYAKLLGNAGYAVYADGGTAYAGYFAGAFSTTYIGGTLLKPGGSFIIDHPLDPENRLLEHSFVESSERKNVYDGVAIANAAGEVVVALPAYFEALNERFCYQLTVIGVPAPNIHIKEEIANGRFVIAGAAAGQQVCWQVTGNRKDPWAQSHPLVVEKDKIEDERGFYLQPEAYGLPATRGLDWKRHGPPPAPPEGQLPPLAAAP